MPSLNLWSCLVSKFNSNACVSLIQKQFTKKRDFFSEWVNFKIYDVTPFFNGL